MNIASSLNAIVDKITIPKNAIAIIVVFFLIVSILVFCHCKDRGIFEGVQVFFQLFAFHIATDTTKGDKFWEGAQNLSRRTREITNLRIGELQ